MNRQEIIENTKYLCDLLSDLSEKITAEHPEIETTVDVSRHFKRNDDGDDYVYVCFLVSTDGCNNYLFNKHIGLSNYTDKFDVEAFVKKVNEMYNNIK